jgi:hypothetical protein
MRRPVDTRRRKGSTLRRMASSNATPFPPVRRKAGSATIPTATRVRFASASPSTARTSAIRRRRWPTPSASAGSIAISSSRRRCGTTSARRTRRSSP